MDYHNKALVNQEYLKNDKTSVTKVFWTKAFRALKNIHSIGFIRCTEIDESSLDLHNCAIRPWIGGTECQATAAAVGDALFEIGIESLAEAEVSVHFLKITCAMTGHFGWENIKGWEKLDLSNLHTLDFNPWTQYLPCMSGRGKPSDFQCAIAARATDALTGVFKKCKDSLEIFTYGKKCPMVWPGAQAVSLSNLKKLSLKFGYLEPRNMQRVRGSSLPISILTSLSTI